jgi:multicomponent Na+:H+ antiporter subunit G
MGAIVDWLSWLCLLGGGFFVLAGGIGVMRLPDVYTRSHAAGMTDTLGAGLILLGLMAQAGFSLITVKLVMILVFIFFTSPTSTHALIHTALASGLRPLLADDENDENDAQRGDETSKT